MTKYKESKNEWSQILAKYRVFGHIHIYSKNNSFFSLSDNQPYCRQEYFQPHSILHICVDFQKQSLYSKEVKLRIQKKHSKVGGVLQ